MEDNAVATNFGHELSVGRDHANTKGIVNLNSGGTLNTPDARIGHNGIGIVNIDGGIFNNTSGWAIIGDGGVSNGTVNMDAGQFNTTDSVFLGMNTGAHGTFNQTGGTTNIGNELALGRNASTGVIDLSGGVMNVAGWTVVGGGRDGGAGTATITVRDGGVFNHAASGGGDLLNGWQNGSSGTINILNGGVMTYNWWMRSGIDAGSTGRITVDGVGSTLNHSVTTGGDSRVLIGEGGTGELTVSDFGQYIHGGSETRVGWHNGSVGTVNVNTSGVMTLNSGSLLVGNESGSQGTVKVESGGKVSVNNGWLQIGEGAGSTGTVTVDGVGSVFEHDLVNAGHSMSIGQGGNGTLIVRNGAVFNDGGSRVLVGP